MVTVRDLIRRPSFQGTTVLAGSAGLDRSVEDISVMEVPDIEEYVSAGGFLLSTLYPVSTHPELLVGLLEKLAALGLSGMGVKLNRYVDSLPPACLEKADALSFSLLLLPPNGNFSSMINDYLKSVLQVKSGELEHRNHIHEQLMDILIHGDSQSDLAKVLSRNLGRDIVLFGSHGELLAECRSTPDSSLDSREVACALQACESEAMVVKKKLLSCYAALHAVRFGRERIGTIAVCWRDGFDLTGLELITLQQCSIVFRIMVQHQIMMEDAALSRRETFACDLIYGIAESEEAAITQASIMKWKMAYPILILAMVIPPPSVQKPPASRRETLAALKRQVWMEHSGGERNDGVFWFENRAVIVSLLNADAARAVAGIEETIDGVLAREGVREYYLSESRTAHRLEDIPRIYQECEYALGIQQKLRRHGAMRFRDLGVYRVIFNSENKEELRSFCADTIGPLVAYDREHEADLVRTLSAVIESGGNLKAASSKLFVHYNTVRYRFRLAGRLLEKDIHDPDDYQAISLAVKIHEALG